MAGLKNVRDLGLDAYMATPVEVAPVMPVAVAPVVHTVFHADPIPDMVAEVAAPAPVPASVSAPVPLVSTRTKPSKSKITPSWKQTGLSLTADTMMRLRLESLKSGKTMSEVAETLLGKHLPHYKIAI